MAKKVAFSKGPGSCCGGARPPDPVPSFTGEAKEAIEVRTVVLIFNPFSGPKKNAGHIVETIVVPMFKDASIEVRLLKTQHKAHAIELARTADLTKVDGLLALGGDGTFSEVLTGLKMRTDGARPPLGFLPGGTGNNFCRHYLLDDRAASAFNIQVQLRQAVQAVIDGVTMTVDSARVDAHTVDGTPHTWYSLNLVGWGLAVDAAVKAEGMRWLGGSRYDVATFMEILKFNKRPCTLTLDGKEFSSKSMLIVMVQNNVHAGKGMVLAPTAKLDDGLVDVLHFDATGKTRAQILSLFTDMKAGGKHVYNKDCEYHRVKTLALETPTPTLVTVDGEGDTWTPLKLEVLSGAFDLFVPRSRSFPKLGSPNSITPQPQGDPGLVTRRGSDLEKGGAILQEGSRANIVARSTRKTWLAKRASFDVDKEHIVKTKYMVEPMESCFTTFEIPGTGGSNVFSPSHLLFDAFSSVSMILHIGALCSLGFVASIPAPAPFGSVTENIFNCVGLWLAFIGTASAVAFHDPDLMTAKWYSVCTFTLFLVLMVFRIGLEQGTERKLHMAAYLFPLAGLIPLALPTLQSVARLTGEPNYMQMEKWSKETFTKTKTLLKTEFAAQLMNTIATLWIALVPLFDCLVFLSPRMSMSEAVVDTVRPIALYMMRRVGYHMYCRGAMQCSRLASFKMMLLPALHISCNSLQVRAAAGVNTWAGFRSFLVVDWFVFLFRTSNFSIQTSPVVALGKVVPTDLPVDVTLPPESDAMRAFRRFARIIFYTTDASKPDPFPGVNKPDWRGFEYMIESITLSANYVCLLLGYLYFYLADMGPGNPAFDFWFPFGKTSLKFILFAASNDLVQDLLSHPIASLASTRWIHCSFNRMFPGWINAWAPPNRLGAKHLSLAVMSVCWVPGTTSYLAYFLRYIGYLPIAQEGSFW